MPVLHNNVIALVVVLFFPKYSVASVNFFTVTHILEK